MYVFLFKSDFDLDFCIIQYNFYIQFSCLLIISISTLYIPKLFQRGIYTYTYCYRNNSLIILNLYYFVNLSKKKSFWIFLIPGDLAFFLPLILQHHVPPSGSLQRLGVFRSFISQFRLYIYCMSWQTVLAASSASAYRLSKLKTSRQTATFRAEAQLL